MPAIVRLSKKELIDLIESTEAAGCDAACLRGLLAEVEEGQPTKRGVPLGEITTEERLEELRQQSTIEHGTDLECMICHEKFDHLLSGACEDCWRAWMLGTKPKG